MRDVQEYLAVEDRFAQLLDVIGIHFYSSKVGKEGFLPMYEFSRHHKQKHSSVSPVAKSERKSKAPFALSARLLPKPPIPFCHLSTESIFLPKFLSQALLLFFSLVTEALIACEESSVLG